MRRNSINLQELTVSKGQAFVHDRFINSNKLSYLSLLNDYQRKQSLPSPQDENLVQNTYQRILNTNLNPNCRSELKQQFLLDASLIQVPHQKYSERC